MNANGFYFIKDTLLSINKIQKIIKADDLKQIWFLKITTDVFATGFPLPDSSIIIDNSIMFTGSDVSHIFQLEKTEFKSGLYIYNVNFNGWNEIRDCDFVELFSCRSDSFKGNGFDIINTHFQKGSDLSNNVFKYPHRIFESIFDSILNISRCEFLSGLLIEDSKVSNLFVNNCSFSNKPIFRRISLADTVDFSNTDFEKGVDLRRTDFQNVTTLYLENTSYPPGELILYWDKIKGIDKPKISLKEKSGDDEDDFKRIEEIYNLLYKNYIAQGDKTSADQVKYELAWQKEIIIGGFWQWLYGLSLGYGYEPLRYLIIPILFSILIFWFVWYEFYYNIVAYILNKDFDSDLELTPHHNVHFPLKKIKFFKVIDHKRISPEINFITKFWHCLHFSSSVLLGIRFKKEWIRFATKHKTGNSSFIWVTTLEYLLGKIYLIL